MTLGDDPIKDPIPEDPIVSSLALTFQEFATANAA